MTLTQIALQPGVNRERTRYANGGTWYECDKVRFRSGSPEKIGGWQRISANTFEGTCRSLWSWVTLNGLNYVGVGTNEKFYIELGGAYFDITPLRKTTTNAATFAATSGSATITITDASHAALSGDYVTFSGAASLGGNITAEVLNAEYVIQTVVNANSYTITATATANGSDTGNGGGSVTAKYQLHVGNANAVPLTGWGGGAWSTGVWGTGGTTQEPMRLWSQTNFGEDLIFAPRGGAIYYWDSSSGVYPRAVELSTLAGASNTPVVQNGVLASDFARFIFAYGTNEQGSTVQDAMLIRWSDQEDAVNWTATATTQAGSLRLTRGTAIITAKQARQEVLVWTNSSLYSLQYLGGDTVWGSQLVGDNLSIISPNSVAYVAGVAFWMGTDTFYSYEGGVLPLPSALRRFVFNDFNYLQALQVVAGSNEAFNEVWWFYCSASASSIDRYVVYNYVDKIWYYGTLSRTAWLDTGTRQYPLAATSSSNLVNHEEGVDDNETATTTAISAYITSGEFDVLDGDRFGFAWRILPDMTFDGSTASSPAATMTLYPLNNSGSGYNNPASEGGVSFANVTRTATLPVEAFTQQLNIRVRARQLAVKVSSSAVGVQWQLGQPRIDTRPDGRR